MGELTFNKNTKYPKGNIGLQGGGSGCAFTAGVLYSLIQDERFIFSKCTGTSGGGLCGAALTQAINKFGYTTEGRDTAQERLISQWKSIAQPDHAASMGRAIDSITRAFNPLLHGHFKGQYSKSMEQHLETTTLNPNALQASSPLKLTVNGVDDNGVEGLFEGDTLNTQSLKATGALPSHFHSVSINGRNFWDGALLGGSNPPIEPLLDGKADYLLFVMTNPPQAPITLQKQSDLTPNDVQDSRNLILHQVYNEIALLLHLREKGADIPPIHIIWPNIDTPWTEADKQDVGETTITNRFKLGIITGEQFKQAHGNTLARKSSISLPRLKAQAHLRHKTLVAA